MRPKNAKKWLLKKIPTTTWGYPNKVYKFEGTEYRVGYIMCQSVLKITKDIRCNRWALKKILPIEKRAKCYGRWQ